MIKKIKRILEFIDFIEQKRFECMIHSGWGKV